MEAPNFVCIFFHVMKCKSNSVKKYPKFVRVIKMYLNGIIPLYAKERYNRFKCCKCVSLALKVHERAENHICDLIFFCRKSYIWFANLVVLPFGIMILPDQSICFQRLYILKICTDLRFFKALLQVCTDGRWNEAGSQLCAQFVDCVEFLQDGRPQVFNRHWWLHLLFPDDCHHCDIFIVNQW